MLRFIFREKASRRPFIAGILLSVGIIALSFVAWFFVLQEHIDRSQQQEIGRIGMLISLGLVTPEDLPIILSEPDYVDYEMGLQALSPFGYDEASSTFQDYRHFWLFRLSMYIVLGSGFVLVVLWTVILALHSRKQCDFLRKVSSILDGVMSGQFYTDLELEYEGETAVLTSLLCAMSRRYQRTMSEVSQERNKMKAFISFISHELKTPIASLKTMNELMHDFDNMSRDQVLEFMSRSQKDIERMEWLVSDVLNIARIEAGTVRFSLKKHDLRRLTGEVVERYAGIAEQKSLELAVLTGSGVPVFCDERWISQAIDNILKNAIDYSPEGGKVSVEISSGETYARLCIGDEGPGIPAEEVGLIFRGFYRGSSSAKIKKGTGLGLALSKAIVTRHGGDIRVKTAEGKGSVFIIELPTRR